MIKDIYNINIHNLYLKFDLCEEFCPNKYNIVYNTKNINDYQKVADDLTKIFFNILYYDNNTNHYWVKLFNNTKQYIYTNPNRYYDVYPKITKIIETLINDMNLIISKTDEFVEYILYVNNVTIYIYVDIQHENMIYSSIYAALLNAVDTAVN